MGNLFELQKGDRVYVIDVYQTAKGNQAFAIGAKVDEMRPDSIVVIIYNDTYQAYSTSDFGRLFFMDYEEANMAAQKLPAPNTIIKYGQEQRTVIGLMVNPKARYTDFLICLNDGRKIEINDFA